MTSAPSPDLLGTVATIVGPACRHQLWLIPLDADDVPERLLVPIEGVPMRRDVVPRLAAAITAIASAAGWERLALVWERPGEAVLTPEESAAAAGLAAAVRLPVRGSFLAGDDDVRAIPLGTAA